MSSEGIWQRYVNITDPPKWVQIDLSEKDEWERLGYPLRELVPEAALVAKEAEIAALRALCLQAADIFDANDFGHDLRFKLRDAALSKNVEG